MFIYLFIQQYLIYNLYILADVVLVHLSLSLWARSIPVLVLVLGGSVLVNITNKPTLVNVETLVRLVFEFNENSSSSVVIRAGISFPALNRPYVIAVLNHR